jgi:hypothetical protein
MVMKTTNVSRTVKANEARSPEFTGMQNTKRFTKLMKMSDISTREEP